MDRINLLDKGYLELQETMGSDLSIVNAARVSYLGESKGADADKKLLFYLMREDHGTPFEMVEFKFRVKAPLFVSKQWMRHRVGWSYNEVSRRYTSEELDFYIPTEWRYQSEDNKQASAGTFKDRSFTQLIREDAEESLNIYYMLLEGNVAREMARMVLPQNMYTTFIAKCNARSMMHFIKLRGDSHAQHEIQVYAFALAKVLKEILPWTYEAFRKYQWFPGTRL